MQHKAERQVDNGSDHDGNDVIGEPPIGNRRSAGILEIVGVVLWLEHIQNMGPIGLICFDDV